MSKSFLKLDGKVAIITGSSDGIGKGIAVEFARHGALLTLTGRSNEKLQKVAAKCNEARAEGLKEAHARNRTCGKTPQTEPIMIAGDINDENIRKKLIDETIKKFGKIDILVNNAGRSNMVPTEQNLGLDPLDEMLDIHIRAPYDLTKRAIEQLIKNKGNIINISSCLSRRSLPMPGMEYGIGKSAMDQFTYWLGRDLGAKGVRANSINPGLVNTNILAEHDGMMSAAVMEKVQSYMKASHALQRAAEPEEIAKVALFLASDDSSFVTGTNLIADGGASVMPAAPVWTMEDMSERL